jgi:hypothetical protein
MAHQAYLNDFLYVVIRPDTTGDTDALIYCSGVNITRFTLITKGLHGLSSNPAIRGLQRVTHGVSSLALSKGATPKAVRGRHCAGITPTDDTWYTEQLRIEDTSGLLPGEIITFAVMSLMEKIVTGCCLNVRPPDDLPKPEKLQLFLESLTGLG